MNLMLPDVAKYAFNDIRTEISAMPIDDPIHDLFEILLCDIRIYWALSRHKAAVSQTSDIDPEEKRQLIIKDLDDLQLTERRTRTDIELLCQYLPQSDATRTLMMASKSTTATSELLTRERREIETQLNTTSA